MPQSNSRSIRALARHLLAVALLGGALEFALAPDARAAAGDLFVTDSVANAILAYAPDGTVRTFASGLDDPQGLAFDSVGNLYVADRGSGNIYKFAADGTRTTFASGLSGPLALSFAGSGLLVAEHDADQVSLILPDGSFGTPRIIGAPIGVAFDNLSSDPNAPEPTTWIASNPDPATSFVERFNEDGTTATFLLGLDPRDIAFSTLPFIDPFDTAFVSSGSGTIYRISTSDGTVGTFVSGLGDLNGLTFRPARFSGDTLAGNLFAADTAGGHIYEVTPDQTQTTFASDSHPNYLAFEPNLFGKLVNISSRLNCLVGEDVLIAGFIITGNTSRQIVMRGIGPSLTDGNPPVAGALADPVLELHKPDGTVITNDNWKDNTAAAQKTLTDTNLEPSNDAESAIVATLEPGAYTAILRGANEGTGVATVEAYDLDPSVAGEAGNISTRGFVSDGDKVMIAGFMIDPSVDDGARVLIRAIGPTLADSGIGNPLQDPSLELHDESGAVIGSNDNWKDTAETEIASSTIAPTDDRESAILANLPAGQYTAIVSAADGSSGVALVEVYHLP